MKNVCVIGMMCMAAVAAHGCFATTWHVDSSGGNDDAAGTSPATVWKSLSRVNKAEIASGDKVLFNCTGKALGDKVVVDEIPPFSFAGLMIRGPVLTARQSL